MTTTMLMAAFFDVLAMVPNDDKLPTMAIMDIITPGTKWGIRKRTFGLHIIISIQLWTTCNQLLPNRGAEIAILIEL
jgi:hypothetical protein